MTARRLPPVWRSRAGTSSLRGAEGRREDPDDRGQWSGRAQGEQERDREPVPCEREHDGGAAADALVRPVARNAEGSPSSNAVRPGGNAQAIERRVRPADREVATRIRRGLDGAIELDGAGSGIGRGGVGGARPNPRPREGAHRSGSARDLGADAGAGWRPSSTWKLPAARVAPRGQGARVSRSRWSGRRRPHRGHSRSGHGFRAAGPRGPAPGRWPGSREGSRRARRARPAPGHRQRGAPCR